MYMQFTTQRHPDNSNLRLCYENHYRGLPVMFEKGPFIEEYLEKLWQTTKRALAVYPRVFAARIDLKFPRSYGMPEYVEHNTVLRRFIESFEAQIRADQIKSSIEGRRVHPTVLRYFWVREVSSDGHPHYHFAFLLNHDAYHTLGRLVTERVNMIYRLEKAWASALRLSILDVGGLVNVPENAAFRLSGDVNDPGVAAFFHRTSYFCKAATKVFSGRTRNCDSSRI